MSRLRNYRSFVDGVAKGQIDPLAVSEESGLRLKASVEPGPTVPVPGAQCIYACFEGRWIEVCHCPRGHVI
jgi:hypothetical protein